MNKRIVALCLVFSVLFSTVASAANFVGKDQSENRI